MIEHGKEGLPWRSAAVGVRQKLDEPKSPPKPLQKERSDRGTMCDLFGLQFFTTSNCFFHHLSFDKLYILSTLEGVPFRPTRLSWIKGGATEIQRPRSGASLKTSMDPENHWCVEGLSGFHSQGPC